MRGTKLELFELFHRASHWWLFISFSGGKWSCSHIDDPRSPAVKLPSLSKCMQMSPSQIVSKLIYSLRVCDIMCTHYGLHYGAMISWIGTSHHFLLRLSYGRPNTGRHLLVLWASYHLHVNQKYSHLFFFDFSYGAHRVMLSFGNPTASLWTNPLFNGVCDDFQ